MSGLKDIALFLGMAVGTAVGLKAISSNPLVLGGLTVATAFGLSKFGHKGLAIPVLVGGAGTTATSVLDGMGGGISSVNPFRKATLEANLKPGVQMGEYTLYSDDVPGHGFN